MKNEAFAGIDLAALTKNQTGACLFDGDRFACGTLYDDNEIIAFIEENHPHVVAIDAPLTLPRGRCCFDDTCCGTRKIRECDRMLISRGYRVFPPGFSFMKQLTMRGKTLKERLGNYETIEVHPRTSMRILEPREFPEAHNEHERDACAAALTAYLYDEGMCEVLGDDEGKVVIPLAPEKLNRRAIQNFEK